MSKNELKLIFALKLPNVGIFGSKCDDFGKTSNMSAVQKVLGTKYKKK